MNINDHNNRYRADVVRFNQILTELRNLAFKINVIERHIVKLRNDLEKEINSRRIRF